MTIMPLARLLFQRLCAVHLDLGPNLSGRLIMGHQMHLQLLT